jgi:hypothetical protein
MAKKCAIFFIIFYAFASGCSEQPHKESKKNVLKTYALTCGGVALKLTSLVLGIKGAKNVIWPQTSHYFITINNKKVYLFALSKNSTLIKQVANTADCLLGVALFGAGNYLTALAKR